MSCGRSLSVLVATIFAIIPPLLNGAMMREGPFVLLPNPKHPIEQGLPGPPSAKAETAVLSTTQNVGAQAVPIRTEAVAPAAATEDTLATAASLNIPITPIALPQITAPPRAGPADCTLLTQCRLYYKSVNVYYWADDSPNSACLPADQQINSAFPNISNIQSPSVYVVFPSITAFDGCRQVGKTFAGLTTSFAPEAMSTVRSDWSIYPFNFTDLPCPPADIPWNRSEGPYQPLLAPPDFLFTLDPAFSTCTPAASQGVDPFKPLKSVTSLSPARARFRPPPN